VHGPRYLRDVGPGILESDELATAGQWYWILECAGPGALFQRFSQPLHDELDIPGLNLSPAFDFGLISIFWVFFEILFGELSRE
jgi:hypothetical protein